MRWYSSNSNSFFESHPVGSKAANQFGLYDMHGNVSEWCEDVYDSGFYSKPEANGPNPVAIKGNEYGRRELAG